MQNQTVTGFELSPVQEQLYAVSKGAPAFQCQSAVRIEGPLDVTGMQAAIAQTVARYEILRTNFRLLAGRRRLLQVVQAPSPVVLPVVDLRGQESAEQGARIAQILRDLREQPLDLDNGTLARFQLLILDESRHLLVLTLSALCADAQTLTNLTEEILLAYAGGGEPEGEPLQYADYAAWQRDLQQSEEAEAQEGRAFWGEEEAAARPLNELPYERRQAGGAFAPEAMAIPLSSRVGVLCAADPAAAQSFLLACWIGLTFRLTHQEEGIVGRGISGRSYEELVAAPGLFARTLPIRWAVTAGTPFAQLLAQLTEATEQAERRQESCPAEGASGAGGAMRTLLDFTWEPRFSRRTIAGTEFSLYAQNCCIERFGLNLVCGLADGEIFAEIQYDAARFPAEEIARLAEQFAQLADGAAADATTPVGALPLLPASERHRLLTEWNATAADYPADQCIHQLFEAQAARTPDALALVCADERLTFQEINAQANRIAHFLRAQGVGPNRPVALCAERSTDMIVGLLAVLKAEAPMSPSPRICPPPACRLPGADPHHGCAYSEPPQGAVRRLDGHAGLPRYRRRPLERRSRPKIPSTSTRPKISPMSSLRPVLPGVPKGVGNRHRGLSTTPPLSPPGSVWPTSRRPSGISARSRH